MKRQKLFLLASLAAAFTSVALNLPASAADLVSSNLGPGNTYGGGGGAASERASGVVELGSAGLVSRAARDLAVVGQRHLRVRSCQVAPSWGRSSLGET